jgi:menaquinone-9 beta-reductase
MRSDVAIVGGGPAGLAVAIGAALLKLEVHVFEKNSGPVDKACGEGLMPSGLLQLEKLGALGHLNREDSSPFRFIEYHQENGTRARGKLPGEGGLGVRRLALSEALRRRAREVGVIFHESCGVRQHRISAEGVALELDDGEHETRILIGADGLHSACRKREGLEGPPQSLKRFGLRRHLKLAPWSDAVEVHFARGVEAYVTPAGTARVGLAFLWEHGAVDEKVSFEHLVSRFPKLQTRLCDVAFDSTPRGAGPLLQSATRRVAPRFALVGDAAGYVDAITGEGLTQAFESAASLVKCLHLALDRNGAVEAFANYERESARAFARYSRLANALLMTARRPVLRSIVVNVLAKSPWMFEKVLGFAVG